MPNGEVIVVIESHDWHVFGECEEKGKQNDWIFHSAALDYIAEYYKDNEPQLTKLHLWTDNCPGQVSSSCLYNDLVAVHNSVLTIKTLFHF